MSEPTGAPASESPQISEEQVRKYMEQLRSAPAEQIISELLSILLNGAQAKVGRNDARLLIDLSAIMVDHARQHLSRELATQVDQALGQLRMAQVQAENAADGSAEPNDLSERPAPPAEQAGAGAAPTRPAQQPSSQQAPPATSRLWVPGRDF